jgi:SAM-dependent methyltransferase
MHPKLHKIARRVYYKIPFRLRLWAGRAVFLPIDVFRRSRGGKPLPPSIRKLVGPGDFAAIGAATVAQLTSEAGLRPEGAFLDIGCGIGRVALPLTTYLLPSTPFAGFDVVPEFIAWCKENITARHPNFRFDLIDVANSEYNRGGELDAASLRFPYPDSAFAIVYAGSVFTHLLPPGAENYIRETARVLKPQGTVAATFFLLNDESRALVDAGQAHIQHRQIGAPPGRRFKSLLGRSRQAHFVPGVLQQPLQSPANTLFIIDNQYVTHCSSLSRFQDRHWGRHARGDMGRGSRGFDRAIG